MTPRRLACVAGTALIFLATGCTDDRTLDAGSSNQKNTSSTIPHDAGAVGTRDGLIPIDSDNVAMAGYNDSTRVMTVLFDSGGLYEYYDVPGSLWEAFVAAQPDPWSLVGYPQLVQGGYAYREITR